MNKYRIKECFMENDGVRYIPQYRFLFLFWRDFVEKTMSPTYIIQVTKIESIYFETLIEAKNYISDKCNEVNDIKVKHKTVYHKV